MNPLGNGNSINISNNIQRVKQLMNNVNMMRNPQLLIKQNPQLEQVIQMCAGKNPEEVFRNMAKNMGVDPESVLRQLQN